MLLSTLWLCVLMAPVLRAGTAPERHGFPEMSAGDVNMTLHDYTVIIPSPNKPLPPYTTIVRFHYLMEQWFSDNQYKLLALSYSQYSGRYTVEDETAWTSPQWPTYADGYYRVESSWKKDGLTPLITVRDGWYLGIYIKQDTIMSKEFFTVDNQQYNVSEYCYPDEWEETYTVGDDTLSTEDSFSVTTTDGYCRRLNYYVEYLPEGGCEDITEDYRQLRLLDSYDEADKSASLHLNVELQSGDTYCWSVEGADELGIYVYAGLLYGSSTKYYDIITCSSAGSQLHLEDDDTYTVLQTVCHDRLDGSGPFSSGREKVTITFTSGVHDVSYDNDFLFIDVYRQKPIHVQDYTLIYGLIGGAAALFLIVIVLAAFGYLYYTNQAKRSPMDIMTTTGAYPRQQKVGPASGTHNEKGLTGGGGGFHMPSLAPADTAFPDANNRSEGGAIPTPTTGSTDEATSAGLQAAALFQGAQPGKKLANVIPGPASYQE